jgi:hypothetical protein
MKTNAYIRKTADGTDVKVITFQKDNKGNYPLYKDAKKLIKSKMESIK